MEKILVTGCAGFIGYHVAHRLLAQGAEVVGLDNLNDYYDVSLKKARLSRLEGGISFRFVPMDVANGEGLAELFRKEKFEKVVHLAAQAGVRYSLVNPQAYIHSNIVGFANLLEACRESVVRHLVFASSSSVYGSNTKLPFSVSDNVDHPRSLYAATKKSNELMAYSHAHVYGLPCTGLRFFTVYGPWGRPDMAIFLFTKAILEGRPLEVFNFGKLRRDFTYIDDIVEGVVRVLDKIPHRSNDDHAGQPDSTTITAPYRIYNIGNNKPVELMDLIGILEARLGKKAIVNFRPLPLGDVPESYADIQYLARDVGFRPQTEITAGVEKFVAWFRDYYSV